jgi:hypothetical protein
MFKSPTVLNKPETNHQQRPSSNNSITSQQPDLQSREFDLYQFSQVESIRKQTSKLIILSVTFHNFESFLEHISRPFIFQWPFVLFWIFSSETISIHKFVSSKFSLFLKALWGVLKTVSESCVLSRIPPSIHQRQFARLPVPRRSDWKALRRQTISKPWSRLVWDIREYGNENERRIWIWMRCYHKSTQGVR